MLFAEHQERKLETGPFAETVAGLPVAVGEAADHGGWW
jgi:hypothetical protein